VPSCSCGPAALAAWRPAGLAACRPGGLPAWRPSRLAGRLPRPPGLMVPEMFLMPFSPDRASQPATSMRIWCCYHDINADLMSLWGVRDCGGRG